MLVRMKTFLLWHGKSCPAGSEVDLPDDAALRYIATNQAERVAAYEAPKAIEAAALDRSQPNAARQFQPHKRK